MAEKLELQQKPAFHGPLIIIFWAWMLACTFYACTRMVAAGDTWVAMACGRHHLNHGVDTVDPFSANSHKAGPTKEDLHTWPQPFQSIAKVFPLKFVQKVHPTGWINQNWGTHTLFYWLATTFGSENDPNYNMLIVWKFTVNILACIVIYKLGRVLGANPALAALAASFALIIGRSYLDVRPAVYSNLLSPLVILVLALSAYKNVRYIWLLIPVCVFWCNVHGGYIYVFITLAAFLGLHTLLSLPRIWGIILYNVSAWPAFFYILSKVDFQAHAKDPYPGWVYTGIVLSCIMLFILVLFLDLAIIRFRDRLVHLNWKQIKQIAVAGVVTFLASILLNPFHLTNLTHTFEVSVSKHAESWRKVNEWHPAFEWKNPVGEEQTFLIMYILMWIIFAGWLICMFLKSDLIHKQKRLNMQPESKESPLPKIDAAIVIVTALNVYMAVRSRRFIPIAAAAACPLLAVLIQHMITNISSKLNFKKTGLWQAPLLSKNKQAVLSLPILILLLVFGTIWFSKFKQVYLDPWPSDNIRNSIFMRMTASNVKPFEVGRFIRENNLTGKMYNYWTEGGALAFLQKPDPETGQIPLKLFMDGRAQAAYNHDKFQTWSYIHAGGPVFTKLYKSRRKATKQDIIDIGSWVSKEMRKRKVWIIIMPSTQLTSAFLKGILTQTDWRIAFINDNQLIAVDLKSSQGQELFTKVLQNTAVFPSDFSRNLTLAHNLINLNDQKAVYQGIEYAKKALELDPCRSAALEIVKGAQRLNNPQELKLFLIDFCNDYMDKKSEYAAQSGYMKRLTCVSIFYDYLSKTMQDKRTDYRNIYKTLRKEYNELVEKAKW